MIESAGAPLFAVALQLPVIEKLCPPAPISLTERAACAVASLSGPSQVALLVGVFFLLGALVVGGRWVYLRLLVGRRRGYEDLPAIPLVFPTGVRASDQAGPRPDLSPAGESESWGLSREGDGLPERRGGISSGDPRRIADGRDHGTRRLERRHEHWHGDEDPDQGEQTLQLLPGRMEVVNGGKQGREIRFVNTAERTYTFGRNPGDGPDYIQLANPTVSREHATMQFVDGRWRIRNLSTTNPLLVNGKRPETPDTEHFLEDGDRVEMGEIVLVFRES